MNDFIINGQWSLPDYLPDCVNSAILDINIEEQPALAWNGSSNPSFKGFTTHFYSNLEDADWCKFIWHKKHALWFAYYAWMTVLERLKCANLLI